MANEQLPQTYAQAIFEQATAEWLLPLKNIAECIKPQDVEKLDQPGMAFAQKQELLSKIVPADSSKEVKNFVALLASRNEVHLLPNIIAEFDRYSQRDGGHNLARVTSAIALSDAEKRQLEDIFRGRYGQQTEFQYAVDSGIVGGVIVRLGDKVIDGSVSGRLAALKEKLK